MVSLRTQMTAYGIVALALAFAVNRERRPIPGHEATEQTSFLERRPASLGAEVASAPRPSPPTEVTATTITLREALAHLRERLPNHVATEQLHGTDDDNPDSLSETQANCRDGKPFSCAFLSRDAVLKVRKFEAGINHGEIDQFGGAEAHAIIAEYGPKLIMECVDGLFNCDLAMRVLSGTPEQSLIVSSYTETCASGKLDTCKALEDINNAGSIGQVAWCSDYPNCPKQIDQDNVQMSKSSAVADWQLCKGGTDSWTCGSILSNNEFGRAEKQIAADNLELSCLETSAGDFTGSCEDVTEYLASFAPDSAAAHADQACDRGSIGSCLDSVRFATGPDEKMKWLGQFCAIYQFNYQPLPMGVRLASNNESDTFCENLASWNGSPEDFFLQPHPNHLFTGMNYKPWEYLVGPD